MTETNNNYLYTCRTYADMHRSIVLDIWGERGYFNVCMCIVCVRGGERGRERERERERGPYAPS